MTQDERRVVLVVKRVFKVSSEILFDAWTRPELMVQWFHAEERWSTPIAESDLREGGAWRIEMRTDDGRVFRPFEVYKAIERPSRLVFTWHPYGEKAYETVVTLRFRELAPNRTELTLVQGGLRNEASRGEHESGWSGCLNVLAFWLLSAEQLEQDLSSPLT